MIKVLGVVLMCTDIVFLGSYFFGLSEGSFKDAVKFFLFWETFIIVLFVSGYMISGGK